MFKLYSVNYEKQQSKEQQLLSVKHSPCSDLKGCGVADDGLYNVSFTSFTSVTMLSPFTALGFDSSGGASFYNCKTTQPLH